MIRLALRNLARRKGRTLLTALMIAGGTALAAFAIGMSAGTYGQTIDLTTRSSVGHLQVQREGFFDSPDLFETVAEPEVAEAALKAHPAITAVTRRVEAGGLFARGSRTVGGLFVGVEPQREGTVTRVPAQVDEGRWLPAEVGEDDPLPVVLGRGLLAALKAKVGDEVSFISQGADGSMAAEIYQVVGVATVEGMGLPVAYVRLPDAQEVLVLGQRVHRVLAAVRDLDAVDRVAGELQVGAGDVALAWRALLPNLARSIEADQGGAWVLLIIILAVVLLGVTNTMLMAVFERTREFGVLLALGTRPARLVVTTIFEGFVLSLAAAAVGGLLGAGVIVWIGDEGIPLGDRGMQFGGVTIDSMPAALTLTGVVVVPLVVVLCGTLAGVLPALRAGRLQPTEALRD